jgi:hypothetical protein
MLCGRPGKRGVKEGVQEYDLLVLFEKMQKSYLSPTSLWKNMDYSNVCSALDL